MDGRHHACDSADFPKKFPRRDGADALYQITRPYCTGYHCRHDKAQMSGLPGLALFGKTSDGRTKLSACGQMRDFVEATNDR